jgi:hypothetical protein
VTDTPEILTDRQIRTAAPTRLTGLLSLIFLTFTVLCLILPLAQTVHHKALERLARLARPLEERRAPTPFPSLGLLLRANGDFARRLNVWFDDRVGFRDLFIRTKNQIDYSLFRTSRKVFIGKDSWLFDRSGYDVFENLSSADMKATEDRFTLLAERLKQRGIRLIVVGYPDKAMVYTDMMSAQMPPIPVDGNFDKLRHFLATQPSLSFIDATALLRRQRTLTADHIYAKHDIHVTEAAQVPVVNAIVTEIARLEGRTDIRLRDYKFAHETIGNDWGAQARFLSLLNPLTERDYPVITDPDRIGGAEPDGKWIIPDRVALQRADEGIGRPFDWEFRSNPELCKQRLPGTVLFGNSFSDLYWDLGLQHYFCFLRRARDPISRFKLFYQTMPPGTKYMIYEFVEFWLPRTAPPDDYAE